MAPTEMKPLPTQPQEAVGLKEQRRHRIERRVGLGLVFAVLVLGAANFLGVRPATVSASGGSLELSVRYASVSRPGLATPWSVRVRSPGGFDGPVVLSTTSSYFEMFDENGLDPDPQRATATGEALVWEFAPPEGEVLTVDYDARLEPAFHTGRSATTSVLVDGDPVVSVTYRTVVMP
ncbi:MAG TPA: hypothetical protein VF097_12305 [Actinomycetota bacterium]